MAFPGGLVPGKQAVWASQRARPVPPGLTWDQTGHSADSKQAGEATSLQCPEQQGQGMQAIVAEEGASLRSACPILLSVLEATELCTLNEQTI